ncbi:GlxA family transcriptional regulator [Sphingomonas faeni]|uniref:GlxA family transcriptional regulator n=1 Tax=Sphingomonas faeni TaxID=185950 RepID=UPI00334F4579
MSDDIEDAASRYTTHNRTLKPLPRFPTSDAGSFLRMTDFEARLIAHECRGERGMRTVRYWDGRWRLRTSPDAAARDRGRRGQHFIRDGSLWTSAGVSSGIDLTLALIEEDFGPRVAIDAARQMVVFMKRAGGQSQFSVPLAAQTRDHGFVEFHAGMAANLGSDLSVPRLAQHACMAPRTFARTYLQKVGSTPAKIGERMRLEAACRTLEETNLALKSFAVQSGYGDEQKLRRACI